MKRLWQVYFITSKLIKMAIEFRLDIYVYEVGADT